MPTRMSRVTPCKIFTEIINHLLRFIGITPWDWLLYLKWYMSLYNVVLHTNIALFFRWMTQATKWYSKQYNIPYQDRHVTNTVCFIPPCLSLTVTVTKALSWIILWLYEKSTEWKAELNPERLLAPTDGTMRKWIQSKENDSGRFN